MPSYEEAVALFERRVRAWLDEDLDAYLALWHDDMTFESPATEPPLRGKEKYALLLSGSRQLVKPVAFDVRHLAVSGDLVFAEWTGEIEWRGTGQRSRWRGMSLCAIEEGLITWWREYWNPADLAPHGASPDSTMHA